VTETVRVSQGAQPTYAGVRVGVMAVGDDHGVLKARLMIRSDSANKRVDLAAGEREDLFGRATVTLGEVEPSGGGRGTVTLVFEDGGA
jgi:hypothetical protein